jgi:hypothetical protein
MAALRKSLVAIVAASFLAGALVAAVVGLWLGAKWHYMGQAEGAIAGVQSTVSALTYLKANQPDRAMGTLEWYLDQHIVTLGDATRRLGSVSSLHFERLALAKAKQYRAAHPFVSASPELGDEVRKILAAEVSNHE